MSLLSYHPLTYSLSDPPMHTRNNLLALTHTHSLAHLLTRTLTHSHATHTLAHLLFIPKGLAYGLITSVNNFGLALFPIIVASIFNYSKSRYIPNCEYFFIFVSSAAFIIGIYLNYLDSKNGNVLNSPSAPTSPVQEGILHSPSKSELYADIENDGRNFDSEEYLITDRNAFKKSAI